MAAKREWKLRAIEAQNDAMVARREERATRKKVAKHKRRAAGARRHAALMQELNTDLIRSTRQTRMEDRIALREAADALAALAADAAALRDVLEHSASEEYVDYLTFRLRENLREAHSILESRGRPDHAADVASLLNDLPADTCTKTT
ncbi:MAG: hypothetical protein GY812_03870 [Actinomycetia bacterium]|nr:hypothetical protein [Actinomycetes bacterium]